ncbi:MAG: PAS domain-containing protein, partial [Bdellovibrionales bacterium]|nr:PAS domain-containing protein [Bdellovibrionales bacterium]
MDKFVVFDQFLDAVFVVNEATEIAYVNQVASDFCGLSAKRLVGKKKLAELFEVADYALPLNKDSLGYDAPGPYLETMMTSLSDRGKSAKVQMAVSP